MVKKNFFKKSVESYNKGYIHQNQTGIIPETQRWLNIFLM